MANDISTRLRAFTVIELMVALVLTALAISFVYAGLRFVQRQSNGLTQQLTGFEEFNRLHTALQADAIQADEIWYSEHGIDFHSPLRTVRFAPLDTVCIRQVSGLTTDTFHIRVDSIACWFLNENRHGAPGPIDEASIHVALQGHPLPITLRKAYDAHTLFTLTNYTDYHEQRY